MKANAVVLAGGDGEVIDPTVRIKGLVPVAGKPMVEWVVDALRAAQTIEGVAVVVPSAENLGAWIDKADRIVVSDAEFIDNVLAGIDAFRTELPTLIATGDLPALTPRAIDDFVCQSLESGAEFAYPLVSQADMMEQFPGSQRTFVKIAGGPVTGGNMALVSPAVVERNRDLGQHLFDTRKSPLAMARVVGLTFVVKLLTGNLRPEDVGKRLGRILGVSCIAIRTSHGSIGADVDKPIDVVVAERVLYERSRGTIGVSATE